MWILELCQCNALIIFLLTSTNASQPISLPPSKERLLEALVDEVITEIPRNLDYRNINVLTPDPVISAIDIINTR